MTRSLYKGPFYAVSLLTQVCKSLNKKKVIKVWSRSSVILPEFLGFKFEIYNGKRFIVLTVTEDMIGYKFGEFALTRKILVHKTKKMIKNKK
jgi:small subunit ribosomal protein S19